MGKPTARYPALNKIGAGGEPPELKHLSRARKRHQPRFLVVASERGEGQTGGSNISGVTDSNMSKHL